VPSLNRRPNAGAAVVVLLLRWLVTMSLSVEVSAVGWCAGPVAVPALDGKPMPTSIEPRPTSIDTVSGPGRFYKSPTLASTTAGPAARAAVDFTPSTGARLPALAELATASCLPYAGHDGKTGRPC
jgi:hypothetical protein